MQKHLGNIKVEWNKKPPTIIADFDEYMEASYEAVKAVHEGIQQGDEYMTKQCLKRTTAMLIWIQWVKEVFEGDRERLGTISFLEVCMLRNKISAMEKLTPVV